MSNQQKIIFKNIWGDKECLSRKSKKASKEELMKILRSDVKDMDFVPHKHKQQNNRIYWVYKDKSIHMDPSNVFGGLSENTNYLFGQCKQKSDTYFLVDIWELVWILSTPTIMLENKKRVIVMLKHIL